MVWAGISVASRTPLVFVPPGVKINADTYKELILEPVVKNLGDTMFNNVEGMGQYSAGNVAYFS